MAKQRIELDVEELFPEDTVKIGKSDIRIVPLGTGQLVTVGRQLKKLVTSLKDDGLTFDNYNEPENVLKLANVVMEEAPELLAEAANVELEDIKALPLPLTVKLLDKVIEVNMASKDALMGNLGNLMGRFVKKKDEKDPNQPNLEVNQSESEESSKS